MRQSSSGELPDPPLFLLDSPGEAGPRPVVYIREYMPGTLGSVENRTNERSAIAQELRSVIARFADSDGPHDTAIEGLRFHRYSLPTKPSCSSFGPALSFVAQGAKRVTLGSEKHDYDDDHYLLVSFDLPIFWEIRRATPGIPFLCLTLDLDLLGIRDLLSHADPLVPHEVPTERGLAVGSMTPSLGDSLVRL